MYKAMRKAVCKAVHKAVHADAVWPGPMVHAKSRTCQERLLVTYVCESAVVTLWVSLLFADAQQVNCCKQDPAGAIRHSCRHMAAEQDAIMCQVAAAAHATMCQVMAPAQEAVFQV